MTKSVIFFAILLTEILLGCSTSEMNNAVDNGVFENRLEQRIEMIEFLGIPKIVNFHVKRDPELLKNSASKFLLDIYNEFNEAEIEDNYEHPRLKMPHYNRYKRALQDDNFITALDRYNIENCNNIITFFSRMETNIEMRMWEKRKHTFVMRFNINGVPKDFNLMHSRLRLYQNSSLGIFKHSQHSSKNITISIYQRLHRIGKEGSETTFRMLSSLNTTTTYHGWLEFNVTRLLTKWVQLNTKEKLIHGPHIMVGVSMSEHTGDAPSLKMHPTDIGLVKPSVTNELAEYHPFIIGYFNGPELMVKLQKLRDKREIMKRKRFIEYRRAPPQADQLYNHHKLCERMNFTIDFIELEMNNWVIAPNKFNAYFCGGECNFPLGAKTNATNHAIIQTLMHLKQPHLPKPNCVPTALGMIQIVHYLNDDSTNLSKYHDSVAKQCGCH